MPRKWKIKVKIKMPQNVPTQAEFDALAQRVQALEAGHQSQDSALTDLGVRVAALENGELPPPPQPTAELSGPTTVNAGQTYTLTVATTNATAATLDGEPCPLNGTVNKTAPPTGGGSFTHDLVVTNPHGQANDFWSIQFTDAPPPPNGDPPIIPQSVETAHGETIPVPVPNPPDCWTVGPGQWEGNRVPQTGQTFAVSHPITLTGSLEAKAGIVLPGGALTRAAGSALKVGTLFVLDGGEESAGPDTVLRLGGLPADPANDPWQWWQGYLGLGKTVWAGTAKTSWLRLTQEPQAGNTILHLESPPQGWLPGDKLVLGDSEQKPSGERVTDNPTAYVNKTELLTVASVSGSQVTLTTPLAHRHPGARNADGSILFLPHVGNLTRDCVVESAEGTTSPPAGVRAHVLFTGTAQPHTVNAELRRLGRTTTAPTDAGNPKGRYQGIHYHHLHHDESLFVATGKRFVANSCTVWDDSPKSPHRWAFTIHSSHYGEVSDCVSYNVGGAHIMTETGNETGNRIFRNLMVTSYPMGDRPDSRGGPTGDKGFEGCGSWEAGLLNTVEDNVAVDCNKGGVYFPVDGTELFTKQTPLGPVDMAKKGFTNHRRNEFYGGMTADGFAPWSIGTTVANWHADAEPSVVEGYRMWHCGVNSVYGYECNNLTWLGCVYVGDPTVMSAGQGRYGHFSGDYLQRNITWQDCRFINLGVGVEFGTVSGNGLQRIVNCEMHNRFNVYHRHCYSQADPTPSFPPARVCEVTGGSWSVPPNGWQFYLDDNQNQAKQSYINGDIILVNNFNNAGQDFKLRYPGAARNAIVPQSGNPNGVGFLLGAPVAGLTNLECLAQHGICVGGDLPPVGGEGAMPNVNGLVEVL